MGPHVLATAAVAPMRGRSVTTELDPYPQLNPAAAPMGVRSVTTELNPFPQLTAEGELFHPPSQEVHHDHGGLGVEEKMGFATSGSDSREVPRRMSIAARREPISTRRSCRRKMPRRFAKRNLNKMANYCWYLMATMTAMMLTTMTTMLTIEVINDGNGRE